MARRRRNRRAPNSKRSGGRSSTVSTTAQGLGAARLSFAEFDRLDDRPAPRDVGIIDFQDALLGPDAYDLVSLLQDARLDVSKEIESELLEHYIGSVKRNEPDFDEDGFRFSYAALGAERNTKILGIFARLAKRDGKRQYLAHIPRIWGYLARSWSTRI